MNSAFLIQGGASRSLGNGDARGCQGSGSRGLDRFSVAAEVPSWSNDWLEKKMLAEL